VEYPDFIRRTVALVTIAVVAVLIVLGVLKIVPYLVIVFTGWVLAVTLEVPVRALQRFGLSRLLAVVIAILAVLVVGGLVIALAIPPFITQTGALLHQLPDAIKEGLDNYSQFRNGSDILTRLLPPLDLKELDRVLAGRDRAERLSDHLAQFANRALPVLGAIGNSILSGFANLLLVALVALLLLLEPTVYYGAIVSIVPERAEARTLEIINMVRRNVVTWLVAMLASMSIATVIFKIVLGLILRLPNAFALSLFAGLATIVPTFGPLIAVVPVAIVASAEGLNKLILAIPLYAAVGLVQDRVITPAIMKNQLAIPAAALVVFQLILAAAIGPLGLLLGAPVLAVIITLVRELFVFGVLHKDDAVPDVVAAEDGTLFLSAPPPDTAASEAEGDE